MSCLAEARGVTVVYRGHAVGIVDANLCVEPGRVIAVIGPNGAGKTSLLRALAGLHPPSKGEVYVEGRSLYSLPLRRRARLAVYTPPTLQAPGLGQTVEEFVAATFYPYTPPLGLEPPRWARSQARRALRELGVEHLAARSLAELSSGEAQRALIAYALARKAPLTLLDEPTSFQDPYGKTLVYQAVRRHAGETGGAVVVATHDLQLAALHADRVVVVAKARIVASGPPGEVLTPKLLEEVYHVKTIHIRVGNRSLPLPVGPSQQNHRG